MSAMPTFPTLEESTGRLGRAVGKGQHEAADAARRDIKAAKLKQAVEKALAGIPPLTDEQREHIAGLLRPGVSK